MQRLSTPVMFEDKLAGLAEVFPVKLKDEASQVISLPVCDIQPADSNPPAVGRFLSGVRSGGLLVQKNNRALSNSELIEWEHVNGGYTLSKTFSQVVYGCVFKWTIISVDPDMVWATPLGGILVICPQDVWTFLPFTGRTIYFTNRGIGYADCKLYGFY